MKVYSIDNFPYSSDIAEDCLLEWLEYREKMVQQGVVFVNGEPVNGADVK